MLKLNLKRVFALRGVQNPLAFMMDCGIIRQTAVNLLNQQTSILKIEHLEIICRLLNCTPNDLFEWQADAQKPVAETHSLNNLKRSRTAQNILQMAKEIPLEAVEKLIGERGE